MATNDSPSLYDEIRPNLLQDHTDLSPVHFIIRPEPEVVLDPEEVQS